MVEKFKIAVRSGKISHAYILEGDKEANKVQIAKEFAKAILYEDEDAQRKIDHDNYEDLIFLKAEGATIKDEAVEELQNRMKNKPLAGNRNIVIVEDADLMTVRAQNRFLKTLEEPTPGTVIILLSENAESLQVTIRSRCVRYRVSSDISKTECPQEEAILLETMVLTGQTLFEIFENDFIKDLDRESTITLLDNLENWYGSISLYDFIPERYENYEADIKTKLKQKNRLYKKEDIHRYVKHIEEAKREIKGNMNISYVLKNLILKLEDK